MASDDRIAKRDFVQLHLALARRALGQNVPLPEDEHQLRLVSEEAERSDEESKE